MPGRLAAGTRRGREDQDLRGCLRADPVQHPDEERRSLLVVHERIVRLRVLVMVMPRAARDGRDAIPRSGRPRQPPSSPPAWTWTGSTLVVVRPVARRATAAEPPPGAPDPREDEHPTAPHPELAPVPDQRHRTRRRRARSASPPRSDPSPHRRSPGAPGRSGSRRCRERSTTTACPTTYRVPNTIARRRSSCDDVMSVIAAMWSQSIPWRNPNQNEATRSPNPNPPSEMAPSTAAGPSSSC